MSRWSKGCLRDPVHRIDDCRLEKPEYAQRVALSPCQRRQPTRAHNAAAQPWRPLPPARSTRYLPWTMDYWDRGVLKQTRCRFASRSVPASGQSHEHPADPFGWRIHDRGQRKGRAGGKRRTEKGMAEDRAAEARAERAFLRIRE